MTHPKHISEIVSDCKSRIGAFRKPKLFDIWMLYEKRENLGDSSVYPENTVVWFNDMVSIVVIENGVKLVAVPYTSGWKSQMPKNWDADVKLFK